MENPSYKDLLNAGVHFGHLKKKWNPKMAPYILMEKNGIHLIDLNKTKKSLEMAGEALKNIARSGKKIMLWGVSFSLLDLAEQYSPDLNDCLVIETGGNQIQIFGGLAGKVIRKVNPVEGRTGFFPQGGYGKILSCPLQVQQFFHYPVTHHSVSHNNDSAHQGSLSRLVNRTGGRRLHASVSG